MTTNHSVKPGKVYLVGGGPGDPGLLTCRARELLVNCDVVCYDELISTAILSLVPPQVGLFPTGYRGYGGSHIGYDMHPQVVEQALQGKTVVRLKAGDPFIFGRATEECTALREQGIDYEVVPGITAALGAAAYAGFPLTSAGIASDVTFASGHQSSKTISSWGAMGSSTGSLVLYMGAKKLAQHAQNLIDLGRDPETPVAHISSATSARQTVTKGTLKTIGDRVLSLDCQDPALVIMGEVVTLSEKIGWRQNLPQAGQQVLIIGGDEAKELIKPLQKMGAEVVYPPLIETRYFFSHDDWRRVIDAKLIAFTDAQAVESWRRKLQATQLDLRSTNWQIFSLSDCVSEKLKTLGVFDFQQTTDNALTEECMVLGLQGKADIAVWSRTAHPPRFELSQPDIAIVTNTQALEILLKKQPELLLGVDCDYHGCDDATELLGKSGINPVELDIEFNQNETNLTT